MLHLQMCCFSHCALKCLKSCPWTLFWSYSQWNLHMDNHSKEKNCLPYNWSSRCVFIFLSSLKSCTSGFCSWRNWGAGGAHHHIYPWFKAQGEVGCMCSIVVLLAKVSKLVICMYNSQWYEHADDTSRTPVTVSRVTSHSLLYYPLQSLNLLISTQTQRWLFKIDCFFLAVCVRGNIQ